MTIPYDDFLKVDIRLGTVLSAIPLPQARRPAYILTIDFGPEIGVKTSTSQITDLYTPADLVGRQVCGVVNFAPRQVGKVMSQVLTLGIYDDQQRVILIGPERPGPNGERVL